jgi:hypothetical protein
MQRGSLDALVHAAGIENEEDLFGQDNDGSDLEFGGMDAFKQNTFIERQRQEQEEEAAERRKVEEQREKDEKETMMKEFYKEHDKATG